MFDDFVSVFNLGDYTDEEKELLRSDFTYKKLLSKISKEARQAAKLDVCYFCGKKVTSFCNSHSVPRFCLENISTNGEVLTLNVAVDSPLFENEKGVNNAGTFHLICKECDSKIFSDYENPDNYSNLPTSKMIAQMALKNSLKYISKRLFEIQLFNTSHINSPGARTICDIKNDINKIDLQEYMASYKKAKKALEKNSDREYYVCYYEKLDYVVPVALQCSVALIVDFNGNIINDIYNKSSEYRIQNIHINILPLKSETIIVMFIEDGDKRYRQFYRQFNKLSLEDRLSALTLIMFLYSEDMYFSKSIENEVRNSVALCDAGKTGQDIVGINPGIDPLEIVKNAHSLDKRSNIPNLLSKKYRIR